MLNCLRGQVLEKRKPSEIRPPLSQQAATITFAQSKLRIPRTVIYPLETSDFLKCVRQISFMTSQCETRDKKV